jgi:DNA gyrase/topoisomerase IV subunit B
MSKQKNVTQNQQGLSADMIENIQNYSDEIKTIESFVDVVRQNPGYHLGSKGNKGLKNMAREIWQNGFDELDKKASPCTWVKITFDERTYGFSCEDNGRGIPFNNILRIYTNPNTSSNYEKKKGEYSSGLHGVGAKVVNAMSHKFIVESYRFDGEARRIELTEGRPWNKGEVKIPNSEKKQGTYVYFEPSVDALGDLSVTWKDVYGWLVNILPLSSIGATVYFTAWDRNGKEYSETLVNNDGIMTYLIKETDTPLIAPIIMSKDTGFMKLDIAFTWDTSESSTDHIIAFANKCPTIFGTHIEGFEAGVTQFFTNYMNKIYLASQKKNKVTVIANDVKCGIKAVVTVSHLHPIFDGQSKEKLSNDDMKPFVRDTIIELLDQWTKANAKDLTKVCGYLKDIADLRSNADKQRVRLTDKYNKSKLTGLPAKFVAPTGKKNKEFFITEGDSAAGLIKNFRINERQGYFPIRGKLPNAFNTSRERFLANAEVAGIIQIIGGGYGRSFDIEKVKWDKIIFCTDADPDGNHIKALLLRFFILYMPQLIEAGRVYATMPPLYGIKLSKGNYVYLRDRMEYIKYIQRDFSKKNTVETVKPKVALKPRELSKVLYTNIDYVYELEKIAHRYALDPVLLECILTLVYNKIPFSKYAATIKKTFKFIDTVEKKKDVIVITGLVGSKYQTVFVNDILVNESKAIFDIMSKNEYLAYYVNGQIMSIYELMKLFDKSAPSSIQRYKGLGEMDGPRLFDSTLDPEKRSLIQYTIESVKDEIESIKYYESNKSSLLTDIKLSRFEVMD